MKENTASSKFLGPVDDPIFQSSFELKKIRFYTSEGETFKEWLPIYETFAALLSIQILATKKQIVIITGETIDARVTKLFKQWRASLDKLADLEVVLYSSKGNAVLTYVFYEVCPLYDMFSVDLDYRYKGIAEFIIDLKYESVETYVHDRP